MTCGPPSCAGFLAAALAAVAAAGLQIAAAGEPAADVATRQYAAAAKLQNLESYDLAAAEWRKFIEQYPNDPRVPQARHYLGVCYYLDNKLEQAHATLHAVVQSDPKFEMLDATYLYLGAAQYGLARAGKPELYPTAADTFGTLATRYPKSPHLPDALHYRAECL